MHSMCVSTLPLQHKENRELNEKLNVVEKTLCMEREKQSREIKNLVRSEQEARDKAEKLPSLLEQLSFLQHELQNTQREKEDLEEQTKVYTEQTQQVGLQHFISFHPTWVPGNFSSYLQWHIAGGKKKVTKLL